MCDLNFGFSTAQRIRWAENLNPKELNESLTQSEYDNYLELNWITLQHDLNHGYLPDVIVMESIPDSVINQSVLEVILNFGYEVYYKTVVDLENEPISSQSVLSDNLEALILNPTRTKDMHKNIVRWIYVFRKITK